MSILLYSSYTLVLLRMSNAYFCLITQLVNLSNFAIVLLTFRFFLPFSPPLFLPFYLANEYNRRAFFSFYASYILKNCKSPHSFYSSFLSPSPSFYSSSNFSMLHLSIFLTLFHLHPYLIIFRVFPVLSKIRSHPLSES